MTIFQFIRGSTTCYSKQLITHTDAEDRLFFIESLTYIEMPAAWNTLWHRPWSIITYMFLHLDLFHVLFNMLCLYWFGKLFLNFFSQKQLVGLYLLGGLGGALLYFVAYNSFPYFASQVNQSYLLGASASIMAIILAVATKSPNYTIRLLLIGDIRMKYFAGITVLISVLSVAGENAGGEFAHLGGAGSGKMRLRDQRDCHSKRPEGDCLERTAANTGRTPVIYSGRRA
jgi:membrane associated rhomboid family serine protease